MVGSEEPDWNILYIDPITLYDKLRPNMADIHKSNNFFYCPAFKNLTSNTFLFKNPMKADFKVNSDNKSITIGENSSPGDIRRIPSIDNSIIISYNLRWIFFAEDENIDIIATSPYFDMPNHLKYASLVPGRFCISNWFRPVVAEFNLNRGVRELIIERDEPIISVTFNTDKKINLIRFAMTKDLETTASICSRSTDWEKWVPLAARYKRFKEGRLREKVLKRIKNNVI